MFKSIPLFTKILLLVAFVAVVTAGYFFVKTVFFPETQEQKRQSIVQKLASTPPVPLMDEQKQTIVNRLKAPPTYVSATSGPNMTPKPVTLTEEQKKKILDNLRK